MRQKHSHLRPRLLRPHQRGWARILTALLILATTTANVGAVGFLHLCPVRGMVETEDCCCPPVDVAQTCPAAPSGPCGDSCAATEPESEAVSDCCEVLVASDRCACGKVLLVEDRSESVVRVSSEFDFAPAVLTIESAWIAAPQDLGLIAHQSHAPPKLSPRPAYLLFCSWTC